ncbi:hypothetical protein HZS_5545 [Henneguya salminicola]|nr:hypothetical protein HZS_5545 [Henneguya salminicola]
MLACSYGGFPRIITIEDELEDVYSNIMDAVSPFAVSPFTVSPLDWCDPYGHKQKRHRPDNKQYIISIGVGSYYELKDIVTSIEGRKLKVCGKAIEQIKNGTNTHHFEREYDIPENVELDSMKTTLSRNGTLHILFDKKHIEPKKELEDLSTDLEFRLKISLQGYKPEEMNVRVVGRELIVEATHKSNVTTEGCTTESCLSGYMSRRIRLGDDVDADKLRVVVSADGALETLLVHLELFEPLLLLFKLHIF